MRGGQKSKKFGLQDREINNKKIKMHFSVWKSNYSINMTVLNLNERENKSSITLFLKGSHAALMHRSVYAIYRLV